MLSGWNASRDARHQWPHRKSAGSSVGSHRRRHRMHRRHRRHRRRDAPFPELLHFGDVEPGDVGLGAASPAVCARAVWVVGQQQRQLGRERVRGLRGLPRVVREPGQPPPKINKTQTKTITVQKVPQQISTRVGAPSPRTRGAARCLSTRLSEETRKANPVERLRCCQKVTHRRKSTLEAPLLCGATPPYLALNCATRGDRGVPGNPVGKM